MQHPSRSARWLVFSLGLLIGAIIPLWAIYHAMNLADVKYPQVGLSPAMRLQPYLQKMASTRDTAVHRIVFLGDSTLGGPGGAIPGRLGRFVRSGSRSSRVEVLPVWQPGFKPFDYYFLADMIVAANPDQLFLPLNLQTLTLTAENSRPELAGWIDGRRLGEAIRLPFQSIGLTLDRLLLYKMIVASGYQAAWSFVTLEQARVGVAWKELATWMAAGRGPNAITAFTIARNNALAAPRLILRESVADLSEGPRTMLSGARLTREGALHTLGVALRGVDSDHPTLRVLGATLRRFRRAGIDVQVYVVPINVEHLNSIGFDTRAGLRESVESVRRTVEANDAGFSDLHRLLQDEAFRDPSHFTSAGLDTLTAALGARVPKHGRAGAPTTR